MSRVNLPEVMVGNEFIMPAPKRRLEVAVSPPVVQPAMAILTAQPVLEDISFDFETAPHGSLAAHLVEFFHRHSLVILTVLLLLVIGSAVKVGAIYWSAHINIQTIQASRLHLPAQPAKGPNLIIGSADLSGSLQRITAQPLNLDIAGKPVPISSETIKSWLQIVKDGKHGVVYIHVNQAVVNKSLSTTAAPYAKAPVNQVVRTQDGSTTVLAGGKNGTQIGDLSPLSQQIYQKLLSGKGLQLTVPVQTLAYSTVSPAAFDKLIEVNVVSKQMWLYQKGNLVKQYPISAGAPATPTPIGQFTIYQKLAVQDMRGYNANGTKYFQPHVHWINYFLPGGYAVHGNYWRPQSWFGAVNSSHGCVSLPDDQAKEVYDWAPVGTTVITHY